MPSCFVRACEQQLYTSAPFCILSDKVPETWEIALQPQSNGKQAGSSGSGANKAAERKVAALQKDKAAMKASLSKAEADAQAAWQQVFEKDRECLDKVRVCYTAWL